MIFNAASTAYVCLRCQLRLSVHSAPVTSILPTRSRARRGVRRQHNESGTRDQDGLEAQAEPASNWRLRRVASQSSMSKESQANQLRSEEASPLPKLPKAWRPRKPHLSARPLGRLHGFRGHKLREKAVDLNMETLGTPSEVIVLRDAGVRFSAPSQLEELQAEEKVDILARLNAERGLIGQAEVEKNIEELKPETSLVTWKDLQMLLRQLVEGFTASQLRRYAESLDSRQQLDRVKSRVGVDRNILGTIVSRTRWVPGVSGTGGDFVSDCLRGYDSEAFTDKQRLVMRLFREYWHLEAMEVAESAGELELETGSVELELLIKGKSSPLRMLSDRLIATREEKIEAFRSRSVIRITAAKEKANIIAQNIEDILRQLRRVQVNLDFLGSRKDGNKGSAGNQNEDPYNDSVINELAQITETHITRLPDDQLAITYFDLKRPEANLSSRADVALRLLLTSSNVANRTASQLGCHDNLESLIAVKYHMKDGMSWRNKQRNWARWTSAQAKFVDPIEDTMHSIEHSAGEIDRVVDIERKALFDSTEKDLGVSMGSPQSDNSHLTSISTSAIVGHILHEVPGGFEVAANPLNPSVSQRTLFQPALMNLSRVLGSRQMDAPSTAELVMRFFPSPWSATGSHALIEFPLLEMRFEVDRETKYLKLRDVNAVVDSTASDVMLPSASLDLRFQQRTMVQLHTSHDKKLPQIEDFLESSQLNMMRGRLETPPGLTLPIASRLCQTIDLGSPSSSQSASFNVEYLFAGLEYRTRLALEYEGWRLLYTSIEGGKADGRRGELSLKPWRVDSETKTKGDMSHGSQEKQTEDFVEAAYNLVHTLENLDIPTVQLMKSRPSITWIGSSKGKPGKDFNYFKRRINLIEGSMKNGSENIRVAHDSISGLEDVVDANNEIQEEYFSETKVE